MAHPPTLDRVSEDDENENENEGVKEEKEDESSEIAQDLDV